MYLFRQPTSGTEDIRKRKVSDNIDPTVAGTFWLLVVLKPIQSKYLEDSSSCEYTLPFEKKEKHAMTLLLRKFLSQRNTDHNKCSIFILYSCQWRL